MEHPESTQQQCRTAAADDHGGDMNIICRRYPKIQVGVVFLIHKLFCRDRASLIHCFGFRVNATSRVDDDDDDSKNAAVEQKS
jgi:hypothetical protein